MSAGASSILSLIQSSQQEITADKTVLSASQGEDLSFSNILDEIGTLIGESVSAEVEVLENELKNNIIQFPVDTEISVTDSETADNEEPAADISDNEQSLPQNVQQAASEVSDNSINESIIANVDFSEVDIPEIEDTTQESERVSDVEQASGSDCVCEEQDENIMQDSEQETEEDTQQETLIFEDSDSVILPEEDKSDSQEQESSSAGEIISELPESADAEILLSPSQGIIENSEQVTVEDNKYTLKSKIIVDSDKNTLPGAAVRLQKQDVTVSKNTEAKQVEDTLIAASVKSEAEAEAENPTVKTSERVAAAAKENAIQQTQDMSSRAKDAGIANLQAAKKLEAKVIESKSASTSGNSLSQSDAGEQIIRMSVENVDGSDTALNNNNFAVQLEKAASANGTNTISNQAAPKELNKADIMNQIHSRLNEFQHTGTNKVTIALNPENLGRIHLEVSSSSEGIIARMQTENPQVKELLEKNMETLKNQLGSQGVNVNNIKVEYTSHTSNNAMDFERQQFNQEFSGQTGQSKTGQNENSNSYADGAEIQGDMTEIEVEQSESQIIHNGKIDYKV